MGKLTEPLTEAFEWYAQVLEKAPTEVQTTVTKLLSVGLPELTVKKGVKLGDILSKEDIATLTALVPTVHKGLKKMLETDLEILRPTDRLHTRVALRKLTIPELRELAKERKIKIPSRANKRDIIDLLLKSPVKDKKQKGGEPLFEEQFGGSLLNDQVKLLALIKLDEIVVRYRLADPSQQLPRHCQKAIRTQFDRAEKEAKQALKNQSGGATPYIIGAAVLGLSACLAITVYIYRAVRGDRPPARPRIPSIPPPQLYPPATPMVSPREEIPQSAVVYESLPVQAAKRADIISDYEAQMAAARQVRSGVEGMIAERRRALAQQPVPQSPWHWVDSFLTLMPPGFSSRIQIPAHMGPFKTDRANIEKTLHSLPDRTPLVRWITVDRQRNDPEALFVLSFREGNQYEHYIILFKPREDYFYMADLDQTRQLQAKSLADLLRKFGFQI